MIDKDPGLETLLELDGEVFPMENGYWTKIEAHRVSPSDQIPHGIRYSLSLHDLSLIHISEPTRLDARSRIPSYA